MAAYGMGAGEARGLAGRRVRAASEVGDDLRGDLLRREDVDRRRAPDRCDGFELVLGALGCLLGNLGGGRRRRARLTPHPTPVPMPISLPLLAGAWQRAWQGAWPPRQPAWHPRKEAHASRSERTPSRAGGAEGRPRRTPRMSPPATRVGPLLPLLPARSSKGPWSRRARDRGAGGRSRTRRAEGVALVCVRAPTTTHSSPPDRECRLWRRRARRWLRGETPARAWSIEPRTPAMRGETRPSACSPRWVIRAMAQKTWANKPTVSRAIQDRPEFVFRHTSTSAKTRAKSDLNARIAPDQGFDACSLPGQPRRNTWKLWARRLDRHSPDGSRPVAARDLSEVA